MMRNLFTALVLTWLWTVSTHALADGTPRDPRNIKHGLRIPDEGYCDQPYVVITNDGAWLCVLTTGAGHEGQGGQHVVSTISRDQGRTWSQLVDIEPADGPEASWVTPLLTPSGRVYVFYDYNGDRIGELDGRPIRADMLGWYCYRYSDDHGATWSAQRYRIPIRVTACDRANDWQGRVQIFWGISKPIVHRDAMLLTFTKLGKYMLDNGEGWLLRSDNILTEPNPDRINWQLLPDGEHGIRHADFGSIQEEHNTVSLADGSLYCIYRTTTGYACHTYSRDNGHTWDTPQQATYAPGGRPIKNPRACPKLWRTAQGKYLLWYHNHSGQTFESRNPAWIVGGVERDGHLHWSQPEILLYDDEPSVRMSYPDLIEQDGRYWVTETQKSIARVHELDPALLEALWNQLDDSHVPQAVDDALLLALSEPRPDEPIDLPAWPALVPGGGFSIEVEITSGEHAQPQVVFDALDPQGRGLQLATTADRALAITFGDGQHQATWHSDPGTLQPGQRQHLVVTVDAGPRLILFVVDGVVCDGGSHRQYGWGRFDPQLVDINPQAQASAAHRGTITQPADGTLHTLRIHGRPLRNAEAVAAARTRIASSSSPVAPSKSGS